MCGHSYTFSGIVDKRKLLYTAISIVAALLLIIPFYMRNWSAFGNPLGPSSETALYQNEKIGIQSLVSNSLRNFAINLTYTPKISAIEEDVVTGIHNLFGWDPSDPELSWQDYKFTIPGFVVNEDTSGNPIHIWLALLVVGMVFVRHKPQSIYATVLTFCVVSRVFVIFTVVKMAALE